MSELSSLYCRVKIAKPQLEKFLSATIEEPTLNKNWSDWWNSRKMYSKMELTQDLLRTYSDKNNQGIIDAWMKYPEAMAFSDYDEATEEWHWGMIFFSENFVEMIPMFAFIISMENYVSESPENGAIVFPFFWGDDDVSSYINFENGKAVLNPQVQTINDINSDFVEQTKVFLNNKWDELAQNINFD